MQQQRDDKKDAPEEEQVDDRAHRKRLAQILRYIASMHQSLNQQSTATAAAAAAGGDHNDGSPLSFVRPIRQQQMNPPASDFFQREADQVNGTSHVLCSIHDFRHLLALQHSNNNNSSSGDYAVPQPFHFYAAAAASARKQQNDNKKRTLAGALKDSLLPARSSPSNQNTTAAAAATQQQPDGNKICWLRMTRFTSSQLVGPPPLPLPTAVSNYLQDWLGDVDTTTTTSTRGPARHPHDQNDNPLTTTGRWLLTRLTLHRLEQAPKPAPTTTPRGRRQIKHFLRQYKLYLVQKTYQQHLEPIYNRLFEWIQQLSDPLELVWGLGHARLQIPTGNDDDDTDDDAAATDTTILVNGPLLEVHCQVELARDGALLVRPREHMGVTLNRQVVAAIQAAAAGNMPQQQQQAQGLFAAVAELDTCQIAPGQPNTYIPLLKRMALELSSVGSFQLSALSSNKTAITTDPTQLVVTEAWCLFCRPKPSSVWARDALAFADAIQQNVGAVAAGSNNSNNNNKPNNLEFCLPMAAWSLTHGPGMLEQVVAQHRQQRHPAAPQPGAASALLGWMNQTIFGPKIAPQKEDDSNQTFMLSKPLFPLPTSAAQNRIADLLLNHEYPAVVCEGPPGTGKTHSIANLICAYLCQGKRVLVTSKNAPALSVLRNRLPASVRGLCVDVSMSELSGMRQLQQTVERLADRICSVSSIVETEKCRYLQRNIADLQQELEAIDEQLMERVEASRRVVSQSAGKRLIELSLRILDTAPWITKQLVQWNAKQVSALRDRVAALVVDAGDPVHQVSEHTVVSDALLSMVASKAGLTLSVVKSSAEAALASIPVVGAISGLKDHLSLVHDMMSDLKINGAVPFSKTEWSIVLRALKRQKAISLLEEEVWKPFERRGEWPQRTLGRNSQQLNEFHAILGYASEAKELAERLNLAGDIDAATEARTLDARRGAIVSRIQSLSEELVDCTVVMELSRSFSVEAQSSLIRFAQIAGNAKFSRTSQPSKMSQRQRRRRQEYQQAFDRCCRFIPCWILTTSQICDYLPSECLFDLVICDESSQSESVSVLPGMLRGKQWLIVGDTKQVSPTDCFVSEDQVDSLRASLPSSPFSGSLLPGQSFFDLCAQAFPRGRVVLSEHFRCAEEIIAFSNEQFYDGRLVPLRLPKKSERMKPTVLDVKVANGEKRGKVNEREADEIVRRIEAIVSAGIVDNCPRSIGVVSLIGEEQSRLIRGRLLDVIGAQQFATHNILVGDPPTFQGAERDIVFLSLVASPGSVPTQSQLMHYQRANVALSRARDQCILVRSIELNDIPSLDDVKIPILEFFGKNGENNVAVLNPDHPTCFIQGQLRKSLEQRGFSVRSMGVVWKNGLCVEQRDGDNRAALLVEGAGESQQEWQASFSQQKAIERVGWQCLRVDALSLLTNYDVTFEAILKFLTVAGVEEPVVLYDALEPEYEERDKRDEELQAGALLDQNQESENTEDDADEPRQGDQEVVVISSNDDDDDNDAGETPRALIDSASPDLAPSGPLDDAGNDNMDASNFGQVVDLNFLSGGGRASFESPEDEPLLPERTRSNAGESYQADKESESSDDDSSNRPRKRPKRSYRRLDKYQRDGRWNPGSSKRNTDHDPDGRNRDWYDTDSDPTPAARKKANRDDGSWKEDNSE